MKLAIAGGGTGGHLFPGIAIAEELLSRNGEHAVLFMGAEGGMEERVVPKQGYPLEVLPSLKGGLMGLDAPRKTMRFCRGYFQARKALLKFEADALVGLGGYASFLPVLASWGVEIPNLIMEQNVIPGRATRHLAGFVNGIGLEFMDASERLSANSKIRHMGNPLREKLVKASYRVARKNTSLLEVSEKPTLLVIGGSQGAQFLNDIIVKAWPKLVKSVPALNVVLLCGAGNEDQAQGAFATAGIRGKVLPFCDEMERLYEQADVVLARAGATSIAEITAFALPSVLIPYPHAVDDHQTANGKVLHDAGAAWSLPQKNLEPERLAQRIADILLQPARRRRMAVAALGLAKPEAASEVVDRLEELAGLSNSKTSGRNFDPPPPPITPPAVHVGIA